MKVMYQTGGYGNPNIKEIEVSRSNESSYWALGADGKERRNARVNSYYNVFDTREQAKDFLIAQAQSKIYRAESVLKQSLIELEKCKAL